MGMHLSKLMEKYPKIDKRLKELKKELKSLSKEELAWVLKSFLPPEKKPNRPLTDYEIFIDKYGLKPACPYCTSRLYHPHGLDDYGKPRYKCRKCGKTYTIMTGTFADKSTFPLSVQIAVINYTLMGLSLSACRRNLAVDYGWHTSEGTILLYRHKFLKALLEHYGMPKLSGVVQVDETYFRENQKGAMELVNVAPTAVKERKPRLENTHIPSELGIFGPEFACVVTGISSEGYVSAVLSGLGKSSSQILEDYFSDYLGDITFLCSDDYDAYTRYCDNNAIPHYIQPSDMKKIVRKEQKDWAEKHNGRELAEETILKRYYQTQGLDRVENYGRLSFAEFERLKAEKHLSLNNIDSFHIQLKRHINKNLTGVATVYLPLYLALYVFKHNWSISHNKQHPTSRHDAENILIDLLQRKGTAYRSEDIKGGNILDYVKPTTHYINNLQELTEEMRRKSNIMGFTFDENDRLLTFNKRKYFRNCGITKLKQICKEYHIKGYTAIDSKERLAKLICELPQVNDIFLGLVAADHLHSQYMEDIQLMIQQAEELG